VPEGHTIHRLAAEHTARFAGQPLGVSSPQGRFGQAAAILDGQVLAGASAHGKHLFLDFAGGRVIHVHLGLYGVFLFAPLPATPPRGAVRLRLVGKEDFADLRGPTACDLLDPVAVAAILARLGPDPLRPDADPERAWARVRASSAPIGGLLMDQAVLSGVGNVYRAEVLFRAGIAPDRPGAKVSRTEWQALWSDLVLLMRAGVASGRIDTVRAEHTPEAMGRPPRQDDHGGEVYVYRRAGMACHVCGEPVRTETMRARNLFWCATCQPC
jgi:formamidopyrimidine-DNA glycosylase